MNLDGVQSRRALLRAGLVLGGALALPASAHRVFQFDAPELPPAADLLAQVAAIDAPPVVATVSAATFGVRPELFARATAALDAHRRSVRHRDRIAIADFALGSAQPRFHLVDLEAGRATALLVAHGSGSDPDHTGFLHRFSNDDGSNASCEGAFSTADYYDGKHGRSQRLLGLDPTNNNALERAIVVHGAWYANADMLATHGKLGRSQGCFAVGEGSLDTVFAALGEGRMIYAAKV